MTEELQIDGSHGAIYNCYIQSSWEIVMSIGTVFVNNRTQAVRLPLDVRLPEGIQKVDIRARGNERIIAPLGQTWDSFFLGGPKVSDDFLPERASQHQSDREAL
jgi:antitoxin VapB